jgi:hypothetical protein
MSRRETRQVVLVEFARRVLGAKRDEVRSVRLDRRGRIVVELRGVPGRFVVSSAGEVSRG